ncbi:MAG: methionine adenosyltransferase [Candidatus Marinimicrobia bacterium]|nr:methionine adenosyltransferase [Candidatus Neomarinimicrobiota bacterium]|tara:strand:- start:754 stop:1956 length:1203 start_codon:yes stop_codon:yes gene_type:complete
MNKNYLFTSESVTEGHPDKVCDMISDGILDEILSLDKNARVACETLITKAKVIVSAEITTSAIIDYKSVVKRTLSNIGYSKEDLGIDNSDDDSFIDVLIKEQSPHIAQGVNKDSNHEQGAGDQGLMFGYACNDTLELMPLPITISHALTKKLTEVRKNGTLQWLKPDGKSQVTVEYNELNKPVKITKVVIATQHDDMLSRFSDENEEHKFIKSNIINYVILPILDQYKLDYEKDFIINGTGRFVEGGPIADVGLTGRKIIVDTYGGYAKHGGGAFSGKDPSKVDRSAAYMARYIAKNLVGAGVAERCEVQLAYCIGIANPMSINVNSFNTSKYDDSYISELICDIFDLRPEKIIKKLKLKNPIYQRFASNGHFGHENDCTWEQLDMVEKIKEKINKYEVI